MMESQKGYFYILTNKNKNVLYAGSTNNLSKRVNEHKKGYQNGFTRKYSVTCLIYFEAFEHIDNAKNRERQIKGWIRRRKIELIELRNKQWKNLSSELIRDPSLRSG